MMFNKSIYVRSCLVCLLVVSQFKVVSASPIKGSDNDTVKVLQRISRLVEQNHYHPKVIDDKFSEELFGKYIAALDPLKNTFLKQDIDSLKKYSLELDDEIHGLKSFDFVSAIHKLYIKRLNEAFTTDKQLLTEPFDFNTDETIRPDGSCTSDFASDSIQFTAIRRKMLKYLILQYFVALQKNNPQYSDAVLKKVATKRTTVWRQQQYDNLLRFADEKRLFDEFVNTMMHIMDPHTEYIAPSKDSTQMTNNNESFVKTAVVQDNGKQIGYISFSSFYSDSLLGGAHCADDVAKALKQLDSIHADGIVFDLRNNHGGSLQEVLRIVGLLIGNNPVVQIKLRSNKPIVLKSPVAKALYKGPLVVMVNEKTASAAEIFTAAMQDYGRGIIVGSRTYGKGTVQRPFYLGEDDGVLKLTIEQFFRVNGSSTQIKGVMPDIVLPDIYAYQKVREKDNADALPWDSIAPARYKKWSSNMNIAFLKKASEERIKKDSSFAIIDADNANMNELQNENISLKQILFKKETEERQAVLSKSEAAEKLPLLLKINVVGNSQDESKNDRFSQMGSDIYLLEAVKVLQDMLSLQKKPSARVG